MKKHFAVSRVIMSLLSAYTIIFFAFQIWALPAEGPSKKASLEEKRSAESWNTLTHLSGELYEKFSRPRWTPLQDDYPFGYVLVSGDDEYDNEFFELRKALAQNLPEDVTLVIQVHKRNKSAVYEKYSKYIDPNRLIVATSTKEDVKNGFWARDAFPIPVRRISTSKGESPYKLVATKYFRQYSAGLDLATSLGFKLTQFDKVFVGGNLLSDAQGRCFVNEGPRLFKLSADDISMMFGCDHVELLPHVAGIGDIDEVIKPIKENIILTNQKSYIERLESLGYKTILFPKIEKSYRTYINSLIVKDTVFMPVYGLPQDQEAQRLYEDLGYKVVPIMSRNMSDRMKGSVHCQTMAYPPMQRSLLLKSLGLEDSLQAYQP